MRIILAAEESDLRLALELTLSNEPGLNIIGTASNAQGLLALVDANVADVVLLDAELPDCLVNDLISQLAEKPENIAVFALGGPASHKQELLIAGARAYFLKGDPPEMLIAAFRQLRKKQVSDSKEPGTKGKPK